MLNSPGPKMAKAPFENYLPVRVCNDYPTWMRSVISGRTKIREGIYLGLVPIICVDAHKLVTVILVSWRDMLNCDILDTIAAQTLAVRHATRRRNSPHELVRDIIHGRQVAQGELSELLEPPGLERCLRRGVVGVEVGTQPGGVLSPHVGADHGARSIGDVEPV